MEVLITYAIIILIVISIVRKKKRMLEGDTNIARSRQQAAQRARNSVNTVSVQRDVAPRPKPVRKNGGVNPNMPNRTIGSITRDGKVSSTLRDDRNNDWLANQMREERNTLFKLREMFGFQMQGRNVTDAELLKEFHAGHCDADRVDRAAGK